MNNESIKEILDKLKDGNWYEEKDLTGTMWIELRWEETHLLLDYITNLQQEQEDYKSRVEKATEYSKGNIQALENRLSTPFCNFEKATKELSIHQNYLELLQGGKDDNN